MGNGRGTIVIQRLGDGRYRLSSPPLEESSIRLLDRLLETNGFKISRISEPNKKPTTGTPQDANIRQMYEEQG